MRPWRDSTGWSSTRFGAGQVVGIECVGCALSVDAVYAAACDA